MSFHQSCCLAGYPHLLVRRDLLVRRSAVEPWGVSARAWDSQIINLFVLVTSSINQSMSKKKSRNSFATKKKQYLKHTIGHNEHKVLV